MSTYLNISDKIKLNSFTPDPDYDALKVYAAAQGYSLPSAGQQILQENLVKDLKTAGVWDKLDVFYVFATDGDSDYATLNYASPSNFQLLKVNSPTFTTNQGFAGDASSAKLTTANGGNEYNMLNDAINPSQDSVTTLAYFNNLGSAGKYLFGSLQLSPTILGHHLGNSSATRVYSSNAITSPLFANSFVGIRRNNSANFDVIEGTTITNNSLPSAGIPNQTFGILGRDGSSGTFTNAEVSFLVHGAALTDAEIADTKTAIETYMNAL